MAFFGKNFWWFVVACVVFGVIFFWSLSGPRLHSPGTSVKDITALLSAIVAVLTGIAGILGLIHKIIVSLRGGSSSDPKAPVETSEPPSRGARSREIADRERVVPDPDDNNYELVETQWYDGWNEDGTRRIVEETVRRKRRRFRFIRQR
jgi:hypothetical protein